MDVLSCILWYCLVNLVTSSSPTEDSDGRAQMEKDWNTGYNGRTMTLEDVAEIEDLLRRFIDTRIARSGVRRSGWITEDPLLRATYSTSTTTTPPPTTPPHTTTTTMAPTTSGGGFFPWPSWPTWFRNRKRRMRLISNRDWNVYKNLKDE